MKGIVLASHGKLAEGMMDTVSIFSGDQKQIASICLNPGDDLADFEQKMEETINSVDTGEGVVVFCDLLFGTPCITIGGLLRKDGFADKVEVVTGMNLSMILEYIGCRENSDMTAEALVDTGRTGIVDFKQLMKERAQK